MIRARFYAAVAMLALAAGAAQATTYSPRQISQTYVQLDSTSDSFSVASATDAISFVATPIDVQIGGTATSVTAVLERSPTDPAVSASWATVDTYMAAPAAVGFKAYQEAGVGWWRVRVTSLTGGTVTINITGRRG